ncbi:phytoene desaturase family protein [Microbacterium enclense]|uniref:Phytoene dehydrogenase-related protein n=1 Tax=Microbacterium enclense TaxID=993073 RepID=A0A1G6KGE8_9MICO|nr:NAD(P)/FAD-dependent oxidoreductase [Microbacterium enclense]KSU54142.1 dehydrogenase [Microbacterium enclense]SDC30149.1 Phytoene dehydrogenase-related protein [Microbacterium enclense]
MTESYDAIIVGSGPNGLAAAVTLARAGLSVAVYERSASFGGASSTAELTLPGFRHDVGSAIHPLALESWFFREFGLDRRIRLLVPELSYAHPLDGGRAGLAYRDLERAADGLGVDGPAYARLMRPLVEHLRGVADFTGNALLRVPGDPLAALFFGIRALEQGGPWWNARFREDVAPSLITGVSAHTILHQPSLAAGGAGLVLATYGHGRGWPVPVGGSQSIADAMIADIRAHGGVLRAGVEVTSLDELPPARAVLLDTTPRALIRLAGRRMPAGYRRALERFRYGGGVAKVDFALSEPVPWAHPDIARAGTVHVGGTRAEIAEAENAVARGRLPEAPYVLAAQPSLFDDTRAPRGAHTLWAYTHVPSGSPADREAAIVSQIERFAPGFRDTILASSARTALDVEAWNPNFPGGDISAGAPTLLQLLGRPVYSPDPWRTPMKGVYLCSSSTSPGPGVHGLGGWQAALSALRHEFGTRVRPDLAPREDQLVTAAS